MIKTLLGIRFRALLSAIGGKNRRGEVKPVSKGKIILMAVLYLYLALCFGALSAVNAFAIGSVIVGSEAEWLFFSLFLALPFFIVLLFSIFEMKAEIFECRDNQILIPLPIPAKTIVFSRVLTVLIYNYLESAVIILPALVVYLAVGGSVSCFFGGLLMSLFVPLFATAISAGIGYVVAVISSHVKRKNVVTLVISLLFLFAYFYFYTKLLTVDGDAEMTDPIVSLLPTLERYRVLRFLGESAMWKPLPAIVTPLVSVGAFALAYFCISRNFMRLVTRAKSVKHVYKEKKEAEKTPFVSLCGKEFLRFASSANYMLNASMGVIMTVVVTVVLITKKNDFSSLCEMIGIETGLYPLLLSLIVGISAMTSISASSVSLEGKNIWLLRSLPIPSKTVLLAKAVPHFLVSAPVCVICALTVSFLTPTTPFERIFAVLLPISVSAAMALLGVAINVWLPKFDWVNEAAVVKQSTPVFIFTFAPLILTVLLVGATFLLTMLGLAVLGLVFGFVLFTAGAAAGYFLLCGPCARKFDTFA